MNEEGRWEEKGRSEKRENGERGRSEVYPPSSWRIYYILKEKGERGSFKRIATAAEGEPWNMMAKERYSIHLGGEVERKRKEERRRIFSSFLPFRFNHFRPFLFSNSPYLSSFFIFSLCLILSASSFILALSEISQRKDTENVSLSL